MRLIILSISVMTALFAATVHGSTRVVHVTNVEQFLGGKYIWQQVSLVGTVRDVCLDAADKEFVFLVLDCNGTTIYGALASSNAVETAEGLQPLLGCRVIASGQSSPAARRHTRRLMRQQLSIGSTNDITILSRPLTGPFDVPDLDSRPPQLQDLVRSGPRKVRGIVTARWQGDNILVRQRSGDSITVKLRDSRLPDLHTTIEAVGLPDSDLYRINLVRGKWRPAVLPELKADTPRKTSLKTFFAKGPYGIINPDGHGHTVRVRGVLKGFLTDETGTRHLLVGEDVFTLRVDCSQTQDALARLEEGSLLEVTGVCVLECESWQPNNIFPKVKGLFLVTRTADDLRVLRRPPWLTPAKFALILAVMLGVLVLILVWNVSLRVLVERRSREVIRAQERKLESELRIGERTRLAADLHDSLAQNLTVVAYQVSAAQNALGEKDAATGECLRTAAKMLKSCRTDLRRCLWDLRSDVLDEPDFAAAIRRTVEPVAKGAELRVRFDGRREKISDPTAHALLCIVRELVANAANHGQAKRIRIAGERRQDGLRLSVRDDGVGFDPMTRPGQTAGHFGIDGIHERLERLGGSLVIESAPKRGAYIRLEIKS